MRVSRRSVFLAAAALVFGCSAPPPPDSDQTPSQDAAVERPDLGRTQGIVDAAIRPILEAHDVPGMAVAVTVRGVPLFFNYGVTAR